MKTENKDSNNFEIWARSRGNAARHNIKMPKIDLSKLEKEESILEEMRQKDGETSVKTEKTKQFE